jgi:hypothetical protein
MLSGDPKFDDAIWMLKIAELNNGIIPVELV